MNESVRIASATSTGNTIRLSASASGQQAVRVSITLQGPLIEGYALRRPLPVTLASEPDGWYVATADAVMVHGDGAGPAQTIADFGQCLIEYYEIVAEGAASGDPDDQEELRHLQEYIVAP